MVRLFLGLWSGDPLPRVCRLSDNLNRQEMTWVDCPMYRWSAQLEIAAENDPFPFDPGMITPYATLDCNEDFWTKNPDGVSTEIVEARDAGERA